MFNDLTKGGYEINPNPERVAALTRRMVVDGKVIPIKSQILDQFADDDICSFCMQESLYQLPITELIEFLPSLFVGKTIEIGSGRGSIGRNLGLEMYDNKMQEDPSIKLVYMLSGQPPVNYGEDVIKMSANDAINKIRPNTVLGCWITEFPRNPLGPNEDNFIGKIDKYILVGNEKTHAQKPILKKRPHKVHKFEWLYSRSKFKEQNVIYEIDMIS